MLKFSNIKNCIYTHDKKNMNKITNLLVFLLLISFILPVTAIKHVSASTDNGIISSQKLHLVGSQGGCTSIENCTAVPPAEPPAAPPNS